jgi:hypothetical protein
MFLRHNTSGADVELVVLTEILGLFLWVLKAEFLRKILFLGDRTLHLILVLI